MSRTTDEGHEAIIQLLENRRDVPARDSDITLAGSLDGGVSGATTI